MAVFTDTVTIYHKTAVNSVDAWVRTVVHGVQWSDKTDKRAENGKISIAKYTQITFPQGTYDGITLDASNEEDAIFFGEITDVISDERGHRLSDLLKEYPRSGRIQSVNDNTDRDYLPNIKVVVA